MSYELNIKGRLLEIIGDEEPYKWASRNGISKSTLYNILNKEGNPRADQLLKISKATGRTIEWLLTGEGPMKRDVAGEVDDKGSPPPLDDDLLATALKMVETMSKDLSIDQDKKASLVSRAYKEFYKVKYDGKEDD